MSRGKTDGVAMATARAAYALELARGRSSIKSAKSALKLAIFATAQQKICCGGPVCFARGLRATGERKSRKAQASLPAKALMLFLECCYSCFAARPCK